MTTTDETWTSALPLPHTPSHQGVVVVRGLGRGARVAGRAAGRLGRRVWRGVVGAVTWLLAFALGRPYAAGAALVVLVVATPVTVGHVILSVVVAAAILTCFGEARARASILVRAAKYGKIRRRVRRRWVTVMTDAGLAKSGGPDNPKRVPKRKRLRPTGVGVRLIVDGSPVGAGVGTLASKADSLRTAFGARDIDLVPDADKPFKTRMDLIFSDPFDKIILPAELPRPSKALHVVVGFDKYREPVQKDLRLPHLVVGMQGAGKSSEVWRVLQALQESGIHHRVRVFDPKGGQEFADLEEAAYYYERNPTKWAEFLEQAFGALHVRQDILRGQGLRKNDFTRDNPLDVMIIDELLTVLAMSDNKTKIDVFGKKTSLDDAFKVYLSTARSAGFTVLACSQLSQKSTIGDVRDLFGYVTCLRVVSDDIVRSVIGDPKLYPAHELPRTEATAGIGYMSTEAGVVKYRSAYLDDDDRAQVARQLRDDSEYYRAARKRS